MPSVCLAELARLVPPRLELREAEAVGVLHLLRRVAAVAQLADRAHLEQLGEREPRVAQLLGRGARGLEVLDRDAARLLALLDLGALLLVDLARAARLELVAEHDGVARAQRLVELGQLDRARLVSVEAVEDLVDRLLVVRCSLVRLLCICLWSLCSRDGVVMACVL